MKVLFALSNPPTKQFMNSRHNVGRIFIESFLIKKLQAQRSDHDRYSCYSFKSQPNLIACVSNSFMNLSGRSLASFMSKNPEIKKHQLLIIHDDLQHRFGNVRIKEKGSAQGHNGVTSVISALRTDNFRRLHLGIDRPNTKDPEDVANYVLQNFKPNQKKELQKMFQNAFHLLETEEYIAKEKPVRK